MEKVPHFYSKIENWRDSLMDRKTVCNWDFYWKYQHLEQCLQIHSVTEQDTLKGFCFFGTDDFIITPSFFKITD